MNAVLHWPDASAGTRRHGPLLLSVALHGSLIAGLIFGLQSTLEQPVPNEIVVSLLALPAENAQAAISPRVRPAPAPKPAPPVAQMPAPRPLAQPLNQPQPAPPAVPQPAATPLPVVQNEPAPAAVAQPAVQVPAVTPAPTASTAVVPVPAPAPPAPALRSPVSVSGVEYLTPPRAEYPISARRAGIEGKVVLRLLIDEKGLPQRADIHQSSGHARLDEAARSAALHALFKPHLEDGQPMPVYALVPISFSLK